MRQLVELCPSLSSFIEETYDDHRRRGSHLSSDELGDLFGHLLQLFEKVFVVIDALDEASDECRTALIDRLASFPLCQFLTSRSLDLVPLLPQGAISLNMDGRTEGDIELFITRKIQTVSRFRRLLMDDQSLRKSLVSKLVEKSNGMYVTF